MKYKALAALFLIVPAALGMTACTQEDREDIVSLKDIRYTGDTDKDLASLCKATTVLTKANNNANTTWSAKVNDLAQEFANKSDDHRFQDLAKGVDLATSIDAETREAGERIIEKTCATI